MSTNTEFLLALNHIFYDYPHIPNKILAISGEWSDYRHLIKQVVSATRFKEALKLKWLSELAKFNYGKILGKITKAGINFITINDPLYPEQLKQISDPPVVLYYQGNVELLRKPCFSVVGPRNHSDYGVMATKKFVSILQNYFVICSGLAKGVDAIAHQTTLENNGDTIAIIGTGLDVEYPAENRSLYSQIRKNGLILSEYPLGISVAPPRFPLRNRIVSGLSKGILITEAKLKSGALITARLANEQNRDVFAVPGAIDNPCSAGTNKLIGQGAIPVREPKDILESYNITDNIKVVLNDSIKKTLTPEFQNITSEENKIITLLNQEPSSADELFEQLTLSFSELLQTLSKLELEQKITLCPGNVWKSLVLLNV